MLQKENALAYFEGTPIMKKKSLIIKTLFAHVLSIFNHGYDDQLRRKTYLIGW
jgi:hypothetical protein